MTTKLYNERRRRRFLHSCDRVYGIPTAAYRTNHVSRRATATTSSRTKQLAHSVYLPTCADAFKTF